MTNPAIPSALADSPECFEDSFHTLRAELIAREERRLVQVGRSPDLFLTKANVILVDELLIFATRGYECFLHHAKHGGNTINEDEQIRQSMSEVYALIHRVQRLIAVPHYDT